MSEKIKMHKILTNIPEEFVVETTDKKSGKTQYFVRFGGLMHLANQKGKPILQTRNVSVKDNEIIYECAGYLIPNDETMKELGIETYSDPRMSMFVSIPTIAHGTTNAQNLSTNMMKYAEVMAETRAEARCLRLLTGCAYTAFEEMDTADLRAEMEITSGAKLYEMESMGGASNRQEMCKELSAIANVTPYSGILAKAFKDNKTSTLSGLNDEVIQSVYKTCMALMKGEQKTLV